MRAPVDITLRIDDQNWKPRSVSGELADVFSNGREVERFVILAHQC